MVRYYWFGNIAKTRIVDDILANISKDRVTTVFDYGCGDGGDWPTILQENPHIRLLAFEPSAKSRKIAVRRLLGHNAEVLTNDSMIELHNVADDIVSFSVFEHVVDLYSFLVQAKQNLTASGLVYLNYEDGHFRYIIDITKFNSWLPAIWGRVRTLVSPLLATIGKKSNYQRKVERLDCEVLVNKAGLSIKKIDYHNLVPLKDIGKSITDELKGEFSCWWLEMEESLNKMLLSDAYIDYKMRLDVKLSEYMLSRTLHIRHTEY